MRISRGTHPASHRDAERAECRSGLFAEEHVALILAHDRAALFGMIVQPADDALHRALPGREQPALLHQRADAGVIAAVLALIADPHHRSVGQPQPARALDLQEEQFDRIGRPGDDRRATVERALLDRGAIVIGDEALARDATADLLALERIAEQPEIDIDEVGRTCVDRHLVATPPIARAADLGLVIARRERLAVADLDRLEILREERTRPARTDAWRGGARWLPVGALRQARGIGAALQ